MKDVRILVTAAVVTDAENGPEPPQFGQPGIRQASRTLRPVEPPRLTFLPHKRKNATREVASMLAVWLPDLGSNQGQTD
jgi:hypothetical protein